MTDREIIIGIDTSNYTTSLSIMYLDGELIANLKRPLAVRPGERGLRQSDAVFSHIKNIPSIMNEAKELLSDRHPSAVGVSGRPRNREDSYMPCFLSGVAVAEGIAAALGVPIYRFSHQCGHIMSALYSSGKCDLLDRDFAAFHISGGTTELLKVRAAECGFNSELVGGTRDLNAGQVIDRIGVHLGLPFPSGCHIEREALLFNGKIRRKKPSVEGTYANLSGLENMAVKLYRDTLDKRHVAAFVLDYISRAVISMCDEYINIYGQMPFVFAGGVMCNSIIKSMLSERFEAYFAEPCMSADNAVGIAELARRQYLREY